MASGKLSGYKLKFLSVVVAASFLMSCVSGSQDTGTIIEPPDVSPDSTSDRVADSPAGSGVETPAGLPSAPDSNPDAGVPPDSGSPPDSTSTPASNAGDTSVTGVFFDSPVANLRYATATHSGVTDAAGQFSYQPGELVVFSIGNINLPPVDARPVVTPVDLFQNGAINHRGVVNVSRLLQSLDDDNNPENGITLSQAVDAIVAPDALDFESTDFSSQLIPVLAAASASLALVPAADAMEHLSGSLLAAGYPAPLLDANQVLLNDTDNNGIPDEFDWDDDGDGVADGFDRFPYDSSEQFDFDGDAIGNNADRDDDNDGVADERDAFPFAASESADFDSDGIGDNADVDDDNDGVYDTSDAFPRNPAEQLDTDGDGIGNRADNDDDNDGHIDALDVFPYSASEYADRDVDGIGDASDDDDDNDGVKDHIDAFPFDPGEFRDSDSDGIGDNADTDDDGDGIPDTEDGAAVGDTALSNTAPVISAPNVVTISDTGISSLISVAVTDAENNAVRISWAVTASPADGNLAIRPASDFTQAALSATVVGAYQVTVQATDGLSEVYKTIDVEVKNSAPVIPPVTLSPESPRGSDRLYALHDPIEDPDNDFLYLTYRWTINGSEVIETLSPVLSPEYIKRDDSVTLLVHATDGANEVTVQAPGSVQVGNALPTVGNIEISPSNAGTNDELFVSIADLIDQDGDSVDLVYQWLLNGEVLSDQSEAALPPGIAKFPDIVSVRVTLSDGIDEVNIDAVSLPLTNTPAELNLDEVPASLNYGEAASFRVMYTDPDGTEVSTVLVDAPDGLTYDAATGLVRWTPMPFMLTRTEQFFAIFGSSLGQTDTIQLMVHDDSRLPPLARSGIAVPSSDYELDIGDFDNDGTAELLSTDSSERIFTVELRGQAVMQDWLYPYAVAPGETIVRVWAHGALESEIIAVTSKGISSIPSRTQPPVRVHDTEIEISSAARGDIDNDGVTEIVYVNERDEWSVVRTDTWEVTSLSIDMQDPDSFFTDYEFVLGNVDADATLEIVVNNGAVVDAVTGQVEWQHTSAFGSLIAIGDVDGDGDTDIVASDRRSNVTSYDPVARTSLWVYDINDFCSLRLYNVDDDPQDELVAGPCQHGAVEIYDGSSGTMVLQQEIDDPVYNSGLRSYSLGDMDADGINELVFSTGTNSSAEDNMVVVSLDSLGDVTPGVAVNLNPSTITSFDIAGWDTSSAQDTAVFVLPGTEGGDSGQRIALLSDTGELSISGVTARNWSNNSAAAVVDHDQDGVAEALVSVGNVYDGELHHIALDDFSLLHLHDDLASANTHSNPEIESVEIGIASDGSAKAILATDDKKIQVYDIATMQADWTSGGLSGGQMYSAIAVDNGNGFDIVVATNTELTLWKPAATGFNKAYTASAGCTYLADVVIDGEIHLACIETDFRDGNATLTLFNANLMKQSEVLLDYSVTAVESNGGQLLLGTSKEINFISRVDETTLVMMNPATGMTLWESVPLVGSITGLELLEDSATGTRRIGISTSRAMYISR